MQPIDKLPVKLVLRNYEVTEKLHKYADVTASIVSWKMTKYLKILPRHYSQPISLDKPFVMAHAKETLFATPELIILLSLMM